MLTGRAAGYTGSVTLGGQELSAVKESALLRNVTLVSLGSHLFKGTVAENLRMAAPMADDNALWAVLKQVRLADFLRSENGLDTQLNEGGSNLSGGQRQRLALARALLHDSPVSLAEQGTHEALLAAGGTYARLWTQQQELENYGKEEASHA